LVNFKKNVTMQEMKKARRNLMFGRAL